MTNNLLVLDQLTKTFREFRAVDSVSLKVPKGSIYGLLGPNGAGKTTIIRMITSIIKPDSGTITLDGEGLTMEHVRAIGYMPEERGLYKKMKVGEQLLYLAQLKGMSKSDAKAGIQEWMERFEIEDWWGKKVEELSKGMQQKIQFITTVVHRPKLIILDEPFSGLDPINTNLIKSEIDRLCEEGATIIFSTHRMEQVEEICEYISLINQGKLILEGTLKDIKNDYKKNIYRIRYEGESPAKILENIEIAEVANNRLDVHVNTDHDLSRIMKSLSQYDGRVLSFEELLPNLNEIFITSVEQNTPLHA